MKRQSQSKSSTPLWMWLVMEVNCTGTWNVRTMNQGKLEVVKQEMARVNIDILAISKLRWTGMGEFNSDDHYIYYCGQESLRRNGVAIIINKRVQKCSTQMQSRKRQNDLCSFPRQAIQYYSNPSQYPDQWCWKSSRTLRKQESTQGSEAPNIKSNTSFQVIHGMKERGIHSAKKSLYWVAQTLNTEIQVWSSTLWANWPILTSANLYHYTRCKPYTP